MTTNTRAWATPSRLLLLVAVVCFILAAFNVAWLELSFLPVGLAFFAAAFLLE